MTSALTHKPDQKRQAEVYDELILINRLHQLPEDVLSRVLRTIAPILLKTAAGKFDSPAVDGQISPAPRISGSETETKSRRSEARKNVLKTGSAVFNDQFNVMTVQVRDLSESGCRIRVASTAHLPNRFNLLIEGFVVTRNCEVRWRSSMELGVRFSEE